MSIRVMTKVWDDGPEDQGELLVLLALSDHSDDAGVCWPSMERIAQKARMSARNVRRIVRKLEEAGYLRTSISSGRSSNKYHINPNPDKLSAMPNPDTDVRVNPDICDTNPDTAMSDKSSIEPSIEPSGDFGSFWKAWPHKVGKDKARKAFKALSQQNQLLAIGRLSAWLEGWRKQNPEANHIHASTYLNGKRWEDDFGGKPTATAKISEKLLVKYAEAIRGQTFMAKHASQEITTELINRNLVTIEECRRAGVA